MCALIRVEFSRNLWDIISILFPVVTARTKITREWSPMCSPTFNFKSIADCALTFLSFIIHPDNLPYKLINWFSAKWFVIPCGVNRFTKENPDKSTLKENTGRYSTGNLCKATSNYGVRNIPRFARKGVIKLKNVIRLIPLWRDAHIGRNLRHVIACAAM